MRMLIAVRFGNVSQRVISTLVAFVFFPISIAWSAEDLFDQLDAQLEAQFQDTDETLEANYQALDAALEAGLNRLTEEVEGVWGREHVVLPSQNVWVDYSENKRLRRRFDFARGVLIVEQLVDEDEDISAVAASVQSAIVAAQGDTVADLAVKDEALTYAAELLAQQGIEVEVKPENSEAAVLGETLVVSSDELDQIATSIESSVQAESSLKRINGSSAGDAKLSNKEESPILQDKMADESSGESAVAQNPGAPSSPGLPVPPLDSQTPDTTEKGPGGAQVVSAEDTGASVQEITESGALGAEGVDGLARLSNASGTIKTDSHVAAPMAKEALLASGASNEFSQATAAMESHASSISTEIAPIADRKKVVVTIPLRADYLTERARQYAPSVAEEADRRQLPVSLIYAIMETESHFNPRARSHIPAFGLMQLVPKSGGLDAYHYVYGEKKVLGPEYFFQPNQNVELGTAYLDLLDKRYLKDIVNPESRLFCTIAAYNTGAGNVAKAFTGGTNIRTAAAAINALSPEAVFEHLVVNLPYAETRNYLKKVRKAQEKYELMTHSAVL